MNLLLRPLEDPNDPVWSVIISIIILFLIGVAWVIYYILGIDERESLGSDDTPESEELLQLPSDDIDKVLDGDTIDVTIDLGFDFIKKRELELLVWTRQRNAPEISKKKH